MVFETELPTNPVLHGGWNIEIDLIYKFVIFAAKKQFFEKNSKMVRSAGNM